MRPPGKRSLAQLAQELADTPGAVPVLLTLHNCDGSAAREALAADVGERHLDSALRWAVAGHLVRRVDASGTLDLDQPEAVYTLTDVGATLTSSLVELARAMSANTRPPTVKQELRGGNQKHPTPYKAPVNQPKTSKKV